MIWQYQISKAAISQVAMPVESFDASKQLVVVPQVDEHLLVAFDCAHQQR